MGKRWIRWAASVYVRFLPQLRPIAQRILDEVFDTEKVEWTWLPPSVPLEKRNEIVVVDLELLEVDEYTDGSRRQAAAAGATTEVAEYLGHYATAAVADVEMVGLVLALEKGYTTVALAMDSQGVITKALQLYTEPARS